MTYLRDDLTPLDGDPQHGDLILYVKEADGPDARWGPLRAAREVYPLSPSWAGGAPNVKRYLLHRYPQLRPGAFGVATTFDGKTLRGYVDHEERFQPISEAGSRLHGLSKEWLSDFTELVEAVPVEATSPGDDVKPVDEIKSRSELHLMPTHTSAAWRTADASRTITWDNPGWRIEGRDTLLARDLFHVLVDREFPLRRVR